MDVLEVTKDNYQELIEIWEASVRATHDFLPEEMRERFYVKEVTSKTRSSSNEPYRGVCNVEFEVDL